MRSKESRDAALTSRPSADSISRTWLCLAAWMQFAAGSLIHQTVTDHWWCGMTDREVIKGLRELLGFRLVAYIAGIGETRELSAWIDGPPLPSTMVMLRLRAAYRVASEIARYESKDIAQIWFTGMNPNLDHRAPASVLRDGNPPVDAVFQAAQQFLGDA